MNAATPYSTSAFFEQLRERRRHPSPVPPANIRVECARNRLLCVRNNRGLAHCCLSFRGLVN